MRDHTYMYMLLFESCLCVCVCVCIQMIAWAKYLSKELNCTISTLIRLLLFDNVKSSLVVSAKGIFNFRLLPTTNFFCRPHILASLCSVTRQALVVLLYGRRLVLCTYMYNYYWFSSLKSCLVKIYVASY